MNQCLTCKAIAILLDRFAHAERQGSATRDADRRPSSSPHSGLLFVLQIPHISMILIFSADDHVRPQTSEEKELYELLSTITQRPASSLSSRWSEPSLTLHTIEISGPKSQLHSNCSLLTLTFTYARCDRNSRTGQIAGIPAHRSRPRPGHHRSGTG